MGGLLLLVKKQENHPDKLNECPPFIGVISKGQACLTTIIFHVRAVSDRGNGPSLFNHMHSIKSIPVIQQKLPPNSPTLNG